MQAFPPLLAHHQHVLRFHQAIHLVHNCLLQRVWLLLVWLQAALAASTEQLPEKLIALREALTAAATGSGDGDSSGGANVSQLVSRHPQLLRHHPQQLQALVQQVRGLVHACIKMQHFETSQLQKAGEAGVTPACQ
jgi:hypothetical protein